VQIVVLETFCCKVLVVRAKLILNLLTTIFQASFSTKVTRINVEFLSRENCCPRYILLHIVGTIVQGLIWLINP
jgi:hypothetical protein